MTYTMHDVNKRLKEIAGDGCQVKWAKVKMHKMGDGYNTHVAVKYENQWKAECGFELRVGENETAGAARRRQANCKASLSKKGIRV